LTEKRALTFVAMLFVVAVAGRLAWLAMRQPAGVLFDDTIQYLDIAENILSGNGPVTSGGAVAARVPVYPAFLAFCEAVFDSPGSARILQAILNAAAVFALWGIGRRLVSEKAGVVAAAVMAVYPFQVFFSGLLLTEALCTVLLAVVFLYLTSLAQRFQWRKAAIVGLGFALATLLKPSVMLLVVFACPFWLMLRRRVRRGVVEYLACVPFFLLAMAPWTVRNYLLTHRFIPATTTFGKSLYEAVGPQADGGPCFDKINDNPPPEATAGAGEVLSDEQYRRAAWREIRQNPGRVARLALVKFKRFWNPVPNDENYRTLLYSLVGIASLVPVVLAAIIGAFRLGRARAVFFILSPVLYFTLLHVILVGSVRYRVPVVPFLFVLAGAAVFPGRRT